MPIMIIRAPNRNYTSRAFSGATSGLLAAGGDIADDELIGAWLVLWL